MYTPVFGTGSSLLHILAQYPKVTLALGLAGAVALLVSSVGPGDHWGNGGVLRNAERQLDRKAPAISMLRSDAELAYLEVKNGPGGNDLSDAAIRYVLSKTSSWTDLEPSDVRKDAGLLEEVRRLYFFDLVQRYGITQAKERFRSGRNFP